MKQSIENGLARIPRLRSHGRPGQAGFRLRAPPFDFAHARKTTQLYKKQALIRKSVNALDFTKVRCLRIVYGLGSIRKPCSRICFYNAETRKRGVDLAQDFGSRLGRRETASTLQKKGLNPSFRQWR